MKRARARSVDLGQAPQKPRMPLWPVYDPDLSRPRQLQKIAQKQQAWEQVFRNARIEYVGISQ